MPKKRLTNIAEEYGIPFEDAQKIVFDNLEEDMVSGKGRNIWLDENGQRMMEDLVAMPVLYRGRVLYPALNPKYVVAYIKDIAQKVNVSIPLRMKGMLNDKVIYIECDNSGNQPKYTYVHPKKR